MTKCVENDTLIDVTADTDVSRLRVDVWAFLHSGSPTAVLLYYTVLCVGVACTDVRRLPPSRFRDRESRL